MINKTEEMHATRIEGLEGAFNRVYTAHKAANKFLRHVYPTPLSQLQENKSGRVISHKTDDIFEYGTAYELVKIHMYGTKEDAEARMAMLARKDEEVKGEWRNSNVKRVKLTEYKKKEDWLDTLQMFESSMRFKSSAFNVRTILEYDEKLKERLARNNFNHNVEKLSRFGFEYEGFGFSESMTDEDDAVIRDYLSENYEIEVNKDILRTAIAVVSQKNQFHPVKARIEERPWDGVNRIGIWPFIELLGAEDTQYHREISEIAMVQAVARIYQPGINAPYTLVLEGGQGTGKSAILKKLAMEPDWFTEGIKNADLTKDEKMVMAKSWIIELGEMRAVVKGDIRDVKDMLTADSDEIRRPYESKTKQVKRQSVFFGTTNQRNYLVDRTGNRRFLPFEGKRTYWEVDERIIDGTLDAMVQQLWAEAKYLFETKYGYGYNLELSERIKEIAKQKQQEAMQMDFVDNMIENYLEELFPENWNTMSRKERKETWRTISQNRRIAGEIVAKTTVTVDEIFEILFADEVYSKTSNEASRLNKKIHSYMDGRTDWARGRFYEVAISGKRKQVRGYIIAD